ncbi:S49 family peptidase [Escherichia coli]
MTAELRNLPHIASMAFNEPLMLEPAYARVFFCALAGQLGISRLTDAVSGDSLTAGEAPAALALSVDDDGPRQARSYQVMNGIAVLPVSGTLVSRTRALQPYSGMTGYNGIIARLQQAASDPMVDGILLDMDTPGGMVAGAFDCADIIARVRDIKPVWALANDMNCSAGQLLASAASRRLVTQTARTGSIGVMMAHSNYGAALEKQGVEITLIYSGSHKVDGNPYSHLPDDVRETLQSRMDATRRMFAQKVSAYTGLSVQAVLDIGAGIENTPDGMQSQVLLAADRIAMINPANGNTKPMFVGQGDQIFMNEVFLKRLTAPTITSGGNPPAFSLTSDGRLTAKNADISGSVNANSGTLNNVTINQNCTIKGMLEATQVRGDFVKAVSKAFPKKVGTWGNTETPNGTVTVTISDDHNFDRQIIIPPIIFNGIAYDDPGSGNNPGGTRYTGYGFEVRKNGVLIASRETKGAIPGSYSAVIDMPSGRGSVTLEFKIFQKGNQGAGNITDCTVIVTKKAASGISIR